MTNKIYNIEEIKELLYPIFVNSPVQRAVVFGSYAQGCARETSDIDIFVDSNGILNGFNFFGIYEKIETKLNKPVDLIEKIDLDETSPIAIEIGKGVVIYEQKR